MMFAYGALMFWLGFCFSSSVYFAYLTGKGEAEGTSPEDTSYENQMTIRAIENAIRDQKQN